LISDWARWNLWSRSESSCFVALISRARWIQGPSEGRSTKVRRSVGKKASTFDGFVKVVDDLVEGAETGSDGDHFFV